MLLLFSLLLLLLLFGLLLAAFGASLGLLLGSLCRLVVTGRLGLLFLLLLFSLLLATFCASLGLLLGSLCRLVVTGRLGLLLLLLLFGPLLPAFGAARLLFLCGLRFLCRLFLLLLGILARLAALGAARLLLFFLGGLLFGLLAARTALLDDLFRCLFTTIRLRDAIFLRDFERLHQAIGQSRLDGDRYRQHGKRHGREKFGSDAHKCLLLQRSRFRCLEPEGHRLSFSHVRSLDRPSGEKKANRLKSDNDD